MNKPGSGDVIFIRDAAIYTPEDRIEGEDLLIESGMIQKIGPDLRQPALEGVRVVDASGLKLVPGLIDLQLNGAFGDDFTTDPGSIWKAAPGLAQYGVTSFLPTIITSPLETITAAQAILKNARPTDYSGPEPLGLHIEGPFLNPERKGAHNPAHLRAPETCAYRNISRQVGVLLVTLAPELPGAKDVIAELVERAVVVSAGHSQATYEQALAAFDLGVRYGTHIFNAMAPFGHFEPGLVGALLNDPRPFIGIIPDGIHLHPAVVNMVARTAGFDRLTLVTDAMAALGNPPGRYRIGDLDVYVDQTSARLESGVLAGSILSMDKALRNFIQMTGCNLMEALRTVSLNPARLLGLDHRIGRVMPGHRADLVLLDDEMQIVVTVCGGRITYQAPGLSNKA